MKKILEQEFDKLNKDNKKVEKRNEWKQLGLFEDEYYLYKETKNE